jgi:hypothetical protein
MPLTKKGKKVLNAFKKEYGLKKGKGIFYAYMNKHPKLKLHRRRK